MKTSTTRKNKTNQSVTWPSTSYFTIKELLKLNSKFIAITLRVRLTNAIIAGEVVEIGLIPGGHGRPQKVFAFLPVTQNTLNKAESKNIVLCENAKKLVNVINVSSSDKTTPAVVTTPVNDHASEPAMATT